ncbi:DUF1858 domain-containing protein [Candidatus Woesebacteria bacterium]|nr:DUF1858 domain-containing protein [Candidatus Woesebacteria bacterium]
MKRIKKTDLIADIVERCPGAAKILTEHDLHCSNCFMSQIETLEMGAELHGMTEKELENLVKEINAKLAKKNDKK